MGNADRITLWTLAALAIGVGAPAAVEPGSGERVTRTREQVLALIEEAGSTRPDWWSSVPLEYRETLDLSFPHPPPTKEWNTRLNVGQYMWSNKGYNPTTTNIFSLDNALAINDIPNSVARGTVVGF